MSQARETVFSIDSAKYIFNIFIFLINLNLFCSVPCKPEGRYKIYISFALPNGWKRIKSSLKNSRLDVAFSAWWQLGMYSTYYVVRRMQYFILQERMGIDEE